MQVTAVREHGGASGRAFKLFGAALALVATGFVAALPAAHPSTRATILMALGLILIWIVCGGIAMRLVRDRVRDAVNAGRVRPAVGFLLMATVLALAEELVTTGMTNAAPLFGVPVGAASITASSNYFDVVLFHSVVVFVPMFAGWAWLLRRYRFSPNSTFWLFGLTGVLAETSFGGLQALVGIGMWVYVYGLMVYLPAYAFQDRAAGRRLPRRRDHVMAVVLPILLAIPVAVVVSAIHPVRVHFPPLQPGS
jgi:hypothetical protein